MWVDKNLIQPYLDAVKECEYMCIHGLREEYQSGILQKHAVVLLTCLLGQVTPNGTEQVHIATYTQADVLCGPDTGSEILKSM